MWEILTMVTKKSWRWIMVGAITVICLCCLGFFQLLLKRCIFWTCAPNRDFSVLDLGIPSSFFPEGSQVGEMNYPSDWLGAIENGHMDVHWKQGMGAAHYTIWRFGTEGQAVSFLKRMNITDQEFGLTPCSGFKSLSLVANDHMITCGWHKFGGYRADLNARYEEYVIALNVILDEKMSMEQFQKIVIFIDNQMRQKLLLK